MITIIVANTWIFSSNLAPKSSKTEPKSIMFGPVKRPAPKLPNRLLLNRTRCVDAVSTFADEIRTSVCYFYLLFIIILLLHNSPSSRFPVSHSNTGKKHQAFAECRSMFDSHPPLVFCTSCRHGTQQWLEERGALYVKQKSNQCGSLLP
jgi:hypothetical protein